MVRKLLFALILFSASLQAQYYYIVVGPPTGKDPRLSQVFDKVFTSLLEFGLSNDSALSFSGEFKLTKEEKDSLCIRFARFYANATKLNNGGMYGIGLVDSLRSNTGYWMEEYFLLSKKGTIEKECSRLRIDFEKPSEKIMIKNILWQEKIPVPKHLHKKFEKTIRMMEKENKKNPAPTALPPTGK